MIDFHKDLVATLSTILPTHYELNLTSNTATPCISYQERNNYTTNSGDNVAYSRISYTVKVWGNDIGELQHYAMRIDEALRVLGFTRTSSGELHDINSTMIQKILTFEALAIENY